MRAGLFIPLFLATCQPKQPEHYDKKILVVVKAEQNASSTVGSIVKPIINFLIP